MKTLRRNRDGVLINGGITQPRAVSNVTVDTGKLSSSVTPRPVSPPEVKSERQEELFAMYENLNNSFAELTFKDLCKQDTMKKKENSSVDVSVDFTDGLAAVKTRLSSVVEPEEMILTGGVILRSNSMRAADRTPEQKEVTKETRVRGSNVTRDVSSKPAGKSLSKQESGQEKHRLGNILKEVKDPALVQHTTLPKETKPAGGAAHTNYCAKCGKYIYFTKTRCLVCGKCYCSSCVKEAMGSMTEGRKCKSCLGRRFSERYIARAGKRCNFAKLPEAVVKAELKWAKNPPRKGAVDRTTQSPMRSPRRSTDNQNHFNQRGNFDLQYAGNKGFTAATPSRSPIRSPARSPWRSIQVEAQQNAPV